MKTADPGPPFFFEKTEKAESDTLVFAGYNSDMSTNTSPDQEQTAAGLPELLQQAVAAHKAGNLDIALPLYGEFLGQNPTHPTGLQLSGLLHSQIGEYDRAIELMRASLQQFPEQAEVANNLGNALAASGRMDEANEAYSRAVKLSPRYIDAWRNLGLSCLQQESYDLARGAFQRCLDINPDDAAACLGLGNVSQRREDYDKAIYYLEKAVKLQPDYAEAHHNLGVCLRLRQRPGEAIRHYEIARGLGLDRAELYQNLGSAQQDIKDINAAIEAYRMAILRNPEDMVSHHLLNTLLWEQELPEGYLQSYREALSRCPASESLALAFGTALNQQEEYAEAERVLTEGLKKNPQSCDLKSLLACTCEGQNDRARALQLHAEAVAGKEPQAMHLVNYTRALLVSQRPEAALKYAEEAVQQTAFDQRAIACLGLCWRMLGDENDRVLNDYDNFIRFYDLPVPARFGNVEEFNQRLASVLEPLHLGKRHPPGQSFSGGTQTHGDLFARPETEIRELLVGITQCTGDYIGKLPQAAAHPLLMRTSERFRFFDPRSVRLQRSGYHTSHVHPLGWISAVYYVQVPNEISTSDTHGGGIRFGEADIDIGWRGKAARTIQPQPGRLVLFPSYMWHGTLPCEADGPRLTVAVDVVPDHEKTLLA